MEPTLDYNFIEGESEIMLEEAFDILFEEVVKSGVSN